jgi:hypothetical protein
VTDQPDVIDVTVDATDLNIWFPMTVTTDQLAENSRKRVSAYPKPAARAASGVAILMRELPRRFPHLAPADIAAVLLHASTLVGTSVVLELHADGVETGPYALLGPNILAVAGERMHTAARQGETTDGGEPA